MGLFDPPTKNVMKRMPPSMVSPLALVQMSAEHLIPDALGRTIKPSLVAMVMATWVEDSIREGIFSLSAWDRASIVTTFNNCRRIVGPRYDVYVEVMNRLAEPRDDQDE